VLKFNALSLGSVLRFRPDLIHVHSPAYLPFAIMVKRLLRIPLVITFHGADLTRVEESCLLQTLVRQADRVLHVASTMSERLGKIVPQEKVVYSSNGVDMDVFSPGDSDRERLIVAAGWFNWKKGFDVLLDAMARVHREEPDWRLLIAGDGELRSKLTERRDSLGLQDVVSMPGSLSREELVAELQRASLFVLSSLTEGLPKVILEGMACGLPVVTTTAGSSAEVVGEAGLVVEPGNAEALAEAIAQLLNDSERREKLSLVAASRAHLFSWDEVARRYDAVYRELVPQK